MDIVAVVLVLAGALATGLYRPIQKHLFNQKVLTESEALVAQCGLASLCAFVGLITLHGGPGPVQESTPLFWGALILTTVANIGIQWANTRARVLGDVSLVTPVAAMTPGLMAFAALFLGEIPSTLGWLGIALIVMGTYAHSREGRGLTDYLKPLWFLFASDHAATDKERNNRRALRIAYLGAFLGTFGVIGDALVARHGNLMLGVGIEFAVLALVFAIFAQTGKKLPDRSFRIMSNAATIGVMGLLYGLPLILFSAALQLAPLAYIGSLKRLSIVITVALGVWVLKEGADNRRIVTALVITLGAILLALDPTPPVIADSADSLFTRFFN